MANSSKTQSKFWLNFKNWAYKQRIYILAFFIPFALMYITYALFKVHPFGNNSVLVLDLNGQYVYYFEALRDAFWGDGSIFYNWSRNLSGEFLGTIGYYLASPFTLIVMLLPRKMILGSLLLMQLAKVGAAGVTFNLFLQKARKVKPMNALIFSTLYALMAYVVTQLMDPMWLDGVVYLPLIMYGIERLVDDKKKLQYIIPLALMFIANFYIGYMTAAFSVIYFIYYIVFGSEKKGNTAYTISSTCVRFGVSSVVAGMCAACMILPVYYALQLGKFEFTTPDFTFQLQFNALDLASKLLPSSYDTVRNEGLPAIYCGMLTVLMLPLFYMNSKISSRMKMGQTFLAGVMFFSMYIKPLDMAWHGFQVPNWLPYRYSFIVSFVLLTMGALAFNNLDGVKGGAIGGTFAGIFVYLLYADKQGYENLDTMSVIWFAIACVACFAILCYSYKEAPNSKAIPIVILLVLSGELVVSSLQTLKDIDEDVAYSKFSSYGDYIQEGRDAVDLLEEYDSGLYRSEKTFHRTVNDNMALGLKGMTHSNSVMNTSAIDFIGTFGIVNRGHYTRYNGSTPVADSLLGIKYVLDKEAKVSEDYEIVDSISTGNSIMVYENPNALSMGYMVNSNIQTMSALESKNPFDNMNALMGTMVSGQSEKYYNPLSQTAEPLYQNITIGNAGTQTKYTPTVEGQDAYIEYYLTAETDDIVYMYLPCINEKKVNIWLSDEKDEDGNFVNHQFIDYYYETQYYCVLELGKFEAGQDIAVRVTVANEYCYMENQWFYYLDDDKFQEDINKLKNNQWNITKWNTTHIQGTITAEENQIMFTTIPNEGGWTVKVDGKTVEPVELANAMIGIPLTSGEHTVKMSYFPRGLTLGITLSVLGILIVVVFYMMDSPKDFDEIFKNLLKKKKKIGTKK